MIPFAWWVAEDENDDQTKADATNSFDTETNRFGGVVRLERMPLLQDTLRLIDRQATIKDEVNSEPDGELDDLILTPEYPDGLDDDESTAESATEERGETNIPNAEIPPTLSSEASDIAFADAESVEEFGGLIDVPPKIAAKAVAEDEAPYDMMVPLNALQVDVIMGQAPLLELDDERIEEDESVADPVSINTYPAAPASAAMTLIPAIVHARQEATRRGSKGKDRREFIPE